MKSVGKDVEKREPSCTIGGNADWCSHYGEQYGISSEKLKMELPSDSLVPLLEIHPKKPETLIQKNICTLIFTAALVTIAKIWKQLKCPSADEWIQKLWYITQWNAIHP